MEDSKNPVMSGVVPAVLECCLAVAQYKCHCLPVLLSQFEADGAEVRAQLSPSTQVLALCGRESTAVPHGKGEVMI